MIDCHQYTITQGVVRALSGSMAIEVVAPNCVDVVLRQQEGKLILHLINQADCKYHEIPWAAPVSITMKLSEKPKKLYRAFEEGEITWKYPDDEGILMVEIPNLHIHSTLVVEK